jgi:hypothetical protein
MRLRTAVALVLAVVPISAQAPGRIPVQVVASFGGPDSDLYNVTGVIRADDGRFVVSSTKPLKVQVYSANGRAVRALGRTGSGPGEFGNSVSLQHWPGDSVLVFSHGTRRWMLFALDGTLVREWPLEEGGALPNRVVLVGGAYAIGAPGAEAPCHAATIRRLAPLDQPFRQVLVDPLGNIWIGRPGSDDWSLHARDGAPRGVITLPGVTPTQLAGNLIMGYREDDDGFSEVVAVRVSGPGFGARPAGATCPAPRISGVPAAAVRTDMRNAMTMAEAYFADHGRYPRSMEDVKGMFTLSRENQGRFLSSAAGGYAFTAWDPETGFRCIVSVGYAIRGYPDGHLGCGT